MKQYIGTKAVKARPMSLGDYNEYRGWTMPEDENPYDRGYLVEYFSDEKPNHPAHEGYITWSPKEAFEASYQSDGEFDFGHALMILKSGGRVQRKGWNGKNMFLFSVPASHNLTVDREPLLSILGEGAKFNYQQHIDMFTADGTIVPWLCSQTDMLATDWQIVSDAQN